MKNVNITESLTIVIVLFKEPFDLINETLQNISSFNIIIIDNDDNHQLKEKILKEFKIYKYILNKKNNGFSAGYNQGIKLSTTKFTLVLGPDCLISPKDINVLVKKLSLYQDALIVSPTAYNNKNELTYSGGPLPENGKMDKFLELEGDVCVENALGACMLFRTLDIQKYDLLFDENFFLYFSDADLCRKIKTLNKSIIQTNEAICTHQHGNIKIKNKFKKIYIREFNYTHDMLYYFYKIKNKQNLEIIRNFQKKIKSLYILLVLRFFTFKYFDFIKIYSRISGYNKFKSRYLNK
jgi:GT2 family glycosyltransferase